MKLSLSWLFDHIAFSKKDIDIPQLAKLFNETTAEIDQIESVKTDLSSLYAASVKENTDFELIVSVPELSKDLALPLRKDLLEDSWFLLKQEGHNVRWATLADVGSSKDGLMPALMMSKEQAYGTWRESVDAEDTIITIDNKAITNRPDLWGHRGCAREVAALLKKELVPEESFLAQLPIVHYDQHAPSTGEHAYDIRIDAPPCKRIATLAITDITYHASIPWMAFRLARVDLRPLDALVDCTNYVMADLGQPMHVFDGNALSHKKIRVRSGLHGEKLTLLDGEEITIEPSMCIISDGDTPISLAGIMGGNDSAIGQKTKALLLESGSFNASTIRLAATRLKKRTEASTRFEKSLDPNQNTTALLRYIKLLDDAHIKYARENGIQSVGMLMQEKIVALSHELIEQKIGMKISIDSIISILKRLEFGVEGDEQLRITVPPFRATKDVSIPEDIVEEIARFVGYKTIIPVLPKRTMQAYSVSSLERKRRLKHMLAYGLSLREVQTYAFYDEEFLTKLSYNPTDTLRIANPLSEHWQRLITSLVPNLLKCVVTNNAQEESLRFFEVNKVWFMEGSSQETEECAGIWYEKKKEIDFYAGKALIERLMSALALPIQWKKPTSSLDPWYDLNQTGELWVGDRVIGRAGKVSKRFIDHLIEGDAFIFELDAHFMHMYEPNTVAVKSPSKYPSTEQDISMLVPHRISVAELEEAILKADNRITHTHLIDSFEKADWPDQKSLTFRYTAEDHDTTLSKEEIENLYKKVVAALQSFGGEIR